MFYLNKKGRRKQFRFSFFSAENDVEVKAPKEKENEVAIKKRLVGQKESFEARYKETRKKSCCS